MANKFYEAANGSLQVLQDTLQYIYLATSHEKLYYAKDVSSGCKDKDNEMYMYILRIKMCYKMVPDKFDFIVLRWRSSGLPTQLVVF